MREHGHFSRSASHLSSAGEGRSPGLADTDPRWRRGPGERRRRGSSLRTCLSGGDASELLDPAGNSLDAPASGVSALVVSKRPLARSSCGNAGGLCPGFPQMCVQGICIIATSSISRLAGRVRRAASRPCAPVDGVSGERRQDSRPAENIRRVIGCRSCSRSEAGRDVHRTRPGTDRQQPNHWIDLIITCRWLTWPGSHAG